MNISVDASRVSQAYGAAFQRLAKLEGFKQKDVLKAEAGVIVKTWAGLTKVARPRTTELYARYRAAKQAFGINRAGKNMFGITVNTGRKDGTPGMFWFRTRNKKWQMTGKVSKAGAIQQRNFHYKDDDWARIEAGMVTYANELKKIIPAAEKARGLARQSVIQIADKLGIDLNKVKGGGNLNAAGIAKARAAIASTGIIHNNGHGTEGGDDIKAYVDLLNTYPYNIKTGMDQVLFGVLARRAKYIEKSYEHGAFKSIATVARAFPNLIVTSGMDTSPVEDAA